MVKKDTRAFQDALTLVSMWGFVVIALNSFSIFDLGPWQTSFLMIIVGGALMLEGQILTIKKWGFDGIRGNEIPYLMTIIVGIFSIIVGIISLPFININNPSLNSFTGLVSILSFVFIAVQRWLI